LMRLARDSAPLKADFPIKVVAQPFAPICNSLKNLAAPAVPGLPAERSGEQANAVASTVQELTNKTMTFAIERWAVTLQSSSGEMSDCAVLLEDDSTAGILVTGVLSFLATEGQWHAQISRGTSPADMLLMHVLQAVEHRACATTWRPSADDVDLLAALCATGAPGCRPKLLQWMVSRQPQMYFLALRVHRALPKWLGGAKAISWAQLLLEGFFMAEGQECGREQSQAASCLAGLLAGCPPDHVASWTQSALAPLLWSEASDGPPPPSLWPLARRLGVLLSTAPTSAPLTAVAERVAELGCARTRRRNQRHELRLLSTLLRRNALEEAALSPVSARLRDLLREPALPNATRAQAWGAHSEACMRMGGAASEMRVALRYAVRHLSDREASGAMVADALARARGSLLEGGNTVVEGLSSHRWPLRAAGLAAAAAVVQHESAPTTMLGAAHGVVDAFREAHGGPETGGWHQSSSPQTCRAKRRRLLLELRELPDDRILGKQVADTQPDDEDFRALCAAVRNRIGAWMES